MMNGKRKYSIHKHAHTHACTLHGILISHKEKLNYAICWKMDGTGDHHGK
jgi:hypothetical protein